jgi:small subunit ribosomal protein S16
MLAIKLQRIGKKHQPSYRFVVAVKKSKMAAPPVEDLGAYNPFTKAANVNKERVSYWIKMGAQPTPTVHNLLVGQGVVTGKKVAIKIKKPVKAEIAPEAAPAKETKAEVAEEVKKEEPKVEAEAAPAAPETSAA